MLSSCLPEEQAKAFGTIVDQATVEVISTLIYYLTAIQMGHCGHAAPHDS